MVMGGLPSSKKFVELVAFSALTPNKCPSPSPLPVELAFGVCGLLGNKPIVCGVENDNHCYVYSFETNTWTKGAQMPFPVVHSSAINIGRDTMLIVGGKSAGAPLINTIILKDGGPITNGPNLPAPFPNNPCLGVGNDNKVLVAAGGTTNAYLLDWTSKAWTKMPNLRYTRSYNHCGRVGNDIVVVGHDQRDAAGRSTEIFSLTTMSWRMGPNLPLNKDHYCCTGIVQMQGSFLLLGMNDNDIYEFEVTTYTWEMRSERLAVGRHNYCAVTIPYEIINC